MQRDFQGLDLNQETSQKPDNAAAPVRTSQLQAQWPFSNKDSFSSSMLSFDSSQKNNDSSACYSTTNYPANQFDAYPFHRSMVNQTNLTMSPAAVPAMPSHSPVVGTTNFRKASKNSQLTMFYNGSVCVYENVAPEKAQAIMLLAGNGPPAPIQAPVPKHNGLDGFAVSQSYGTTPHCLGPVPVMNSISVSPSGTNLAKIVEPQNVVSSLGAAPFSSDAVPQFRRRSLTRFMERRKERSIAANPYGSCSKP